MQKSLGVVLPIVILSTLSQHSFATTGYFMHGYGVKAQGNAGASIAAFNDALTIASNPSGLAWLDSRVDVGATLFNPKRSSEIVGNLAGANGQYSANGREYFVLPEIAINKKVNDSVTLGLAVYGNGGMNTSYRNNPYAAFGNTGEAGVDLTQIFVSPSVAWRYSENQSIGVATNFLYQRFEAKGISGFAPFSTDGEHLSNQGKDSSTGIGVRVGWSAKLNDVVTVGANYSSKIKADKFDQYRGLFAQAGSFDVPESYGVGVSVKASPALTLLADVQRINYSDVDSVGNVFSFDSLMAGNAFGSEKGQGFGWKDINVYKVGASYQLNPQLTLRAGYSHNDQPISESQTFLNILAPGVIKDHVSVGATWNIDRAQELSVAYTYGLKETVKGNQSIPIAFGGGEANIEMDQHILGLSYGVKF
ncbi:putative outer membrane protein precursor [Acinetobacter venetianus]|uniref:Putative outer membrane protein n=1 Tax=Acinetobacter venetianus TaxID=52133 RepID=A0A150HJ07_9GAMM|nr:outer membrane protein transport protein [Acinetobacter venetianus]KXZ62059.1 putative outer membrane protein precursor [Acinetobacter venetianus]